MTTPSPPILGSGFTLTLVSPPVLTSTSLTDTVAVSVAKEVPTSRRVDKATVSSVKMAQGAVDVAAGRSSARTERTVMVTLSFSTSSSISFSTSCDEKATVDEVKRGAT